jgi:hypothetical protein
MDDLVQFLHARYDEDERIARAAGSGWYGYEPTQQIAFVSPEDSAHIAAHSPARVLREINAKRQIVRQAFEHAAVIDGEWGCCHDAEAIEAGYCDEQRPNDLRLLRLIALPYADHPDYREEWRP